VKANECSAPYIFDGIFYMITKYTSELLIRFTFYSETVGSKIAKKTK
jgi:hypothetical protein